MTQTDTIEMARRFITELPHVKALNISLVSLVPGRACFLLPYDTRLVGDPETGVMAGGALSTLLDSTCGAAVVSHPLSAGEAATLDLRIDYMRTGTPGQALRAEAHCYHVTRSVAFVRAQAMDDDPDLPVATATGAFTFAMTPAAS